MGESTKKSQPRGPSEPEFLIAGKVLAPWGVKGEVKVELMTDFPERFAPSRQVYIDGYPMTIERSRWHNKRMVIKLATIDRFEDAERLRGRYLEIPRSQLYSLPQGHYYQFQLIGLEVWSDKGEPLGNIAEILTTGSNDIYLVRGHHGEFLIPAIEDVVKSVELEQGRIVIELIDGLLEK